MRFARPTSATNIAAALNNSALDDSETWLVASAEATLERQISFAGIAAPTGDESRRASAVAEALRIAVGCTPHRDAVGNVIARVNPSRVTARDAAPLVLMAHLDTVFEHTELPSARRDGSRVMLPGIGDNGRGLAALVSLGAALQREPVRALLPRPIELVATVGEEGAGNLRGARQYFSDRADTPIAAAIAIDGPGDAHIVHYGIASRRLRVTFDGPGGHPWVDRTHPNSAHAVANAIAMVHRARQRPEATITVTRIGGGESLTSIPRHAWFDVDLRTLDAADMPALDVMMRDVARAAANAAASPSVPLHVSFEVLGDRPGGVLSAQHPLVRVAESASHALKIESRSASGSTDANVPLALGIPAIAIGAGGTGGGAHTIDEWYDDTDGSRGLARALRIILGAAQLETR